MKTVLVIGLIVTLSLLAAKKPKWTHLRAADFPAKVKAVVFENSVLDEEHGVSWGAWNVKFGSERPIAKLNQCDEDFCPSIEVTGLVCSNSVVGSKECSFFFAWTTQGGVCKLLNASDAMIGIDCPDDLQLER